MEGIRRRLCQVVHRIEGSLASVMDYVHLFGFISRFVGCARRYRVRMCACMCV